MDMVKQSLYRPGQDMRFPGGWSSHISRQSAHVDVKVVSPTHRLPLLLRKKSWYSFLLKVIRPQGFIAAERIMLVKKKIEPASFRLAVPCLNQLHHRVPLPPPVLQELDYNLSVYVHLYNSLCESSKCTIGKSSEHICETLDSVTVWTQPHITNINSLSNDQKTKKVEHCIREKLPARCLVSVGHTTIGHEYWVPV